MRIALQIPNMYFWLEMLKQKQVFIIKIKTFFSGDFSTKINKVFFNLKIRQDLQGSGSPDVTGKLWFKKYKIKSNFITLFLWDY